MKVQIKFKPHYTDEEKSIISNEENIKEIVLSLLYGQDNVNEIKIRSIK